MTNLAEENQIHRGIQHELLEMFEAVEGKTFEDENVKISNYMDFLEVVKRVVDNEIYLYEEQ